MGLSVNGKPPVSKTGTPRSNRGRPVQVIQQYLKETLVEMKKVAWPDRRYVTVATLIILVLVFLTGVFVTVVDFGLAKIFGVLMRR